MRLFEHPDFATIVLDTAQETGIPPAFVEKDYYVTEALRIAATHLGELVVFKGGTSLSKGWGLIQRFSEDIDLFVDPSRFEPPLKSKKRIDKTLRNLRDAIADHPGLTYVDDEGHTSGGLAREDYFAFRPRLETIPGVRAAVMVEPGIRSGNFPTEEVALRSYVAANLEQRGVTGIADDLEPFEMTLLHYRRTFVEKLFTVHSKVETMLAGGREVQRDARHYADIHVLGQTDAVQQMLRSEEYGEVKADCDAKSRQYFKGYCSPPGLKLSQSRALFPDNHLVERLRTEYETQCSLLFYGPYPSFDEVLSGLATIRCLL